MEQILVTANTPDFEGDDLFPGNDIQSLFTASNRKNEAESYNTFSATQITNGELSTLLSDVIVKAQYFAAKDDEKSDSIILNPTAVNILQNWLTGIDSEAICLIIPELIGTSISAVQIRKWNKVGFGVLVSVNLIEELYILKVSLSIDFQTTKDGDFSFSMSTVSVPLTLPIFEISK